MLKKLASLLCLFHATLDNNLVCPNNLYAKSKRGGYNLYGKTMWRLIRIAICMTELDHTRAYAASMRRNEPTRLLRKDRLNGPLRADLRGNFASHGKFGGPCYVADDVKLRTGATLCVRPIKVEGLCPADL